MFKGWIYYLTCFEACLNFRVVTAASQAEVKIDDRVSLVFGDDYTRTVREKLRTSFIESF